MTVELKSHLNLINDMVAVNNPRHDFLIRLCFECLDKGLAQRLQPTFVELVGKVIHFNIGMEEFNKGVQIMSIEGSQVAIDNIRRLLSSNHARNIKRFTPQIKFSAVTTLPIFTTDTAINQTALETWVTRNSGHTETHVSTIDGYFS